MAWRELAMCSQLLVAGRVLARFPLYTDRENAPAFRNPFNARSLCDLREKEYPQNMTLVGVLPCKDRGQGLIEKLTLHRSGDKRKVGQSQAARFFIRIRTGRLRTSAVLASWLAELRLFLNGKPASNKAVPAYTDRQPAYTSFPRWKIGSTPLALASSVCSSCGSRGL